MIGFKKTWFYVFCVIAMFVSSSYGMTMLKPNMSLEMENNHSNGYKPAAQVMQDTDTTDSATV